jgi:hypothetical protein
VELLETAVTERDGVTLSARLAFVPPEHWFRGAAQALLAEISGSGNRGTDLRE